MLRDFIGIRVNRAKKSGMVNITSSVNSRERSGINTILHFFFNDTATTEIYTLSLHDALPISRCWPRFSAFAPGGRVSNRRGASRSGEHTSELQSQSKFVCRLLLDKCLGILLVSGLIVPRKAAWSI